MKALLYYYCICLFVYTNSTTPMLASPPRCWRHSADSVRSRSPGFVRRCVGSHVGSRRKRPPGASSAAGGNGTKMGLPRCFSTVLRSEQTRKEIAHIHWNPYLLDVFWITPSLPTKEIGVCFFQRARPWTPIVFGQIGTLKQLFIFSWTFSMNEDWVVGGGFHYISHPMVLLTIAASTTIITTSKQQILVK